MSTTDHLITSVAAVLLAIIGIAAISVLVSRQSATPSVLAAGGGAFSQALCTALSPVGGGLVGDLTGCRGLIPNVTSNITFGGGV